MNYPLMAAIHRFAAGTRMRNEHLLQEAQNQTALNASEFAHQVESLIKRVSWSFNRFIGITSPPCIRAGHTAIITM